jgi:hypothetical protein
VGQSIFYLKLVAVAAILGGLLALFFYAESSGWGENNTTRVN